MKIAFVTIGYSSSWGGAEMVAVNLSRVLKERGFKVDLYADRVQADAAGGADVHRIPSVKFLSAVRRLSFNRNVSKVLSGKEYDVRLGLCQFFPLDVYRASGGVHAHWMRLRYPNAFFRALKYMTSPVNLAMWWLESNLMKKRNHRMIITNSKLVKSHIIRYFNLDSDTIRVVYNGVNHDVFNPDLKQKYGSFRKALGVPGGRVVALFVANNWERKGLPTIIRALARVEGVTVVVVGRGRKGKFLRLAERCGLDSQSLIFAGATGNIEKFYAAADFFVLPTQYDPCSNACLEAMACGLPVITTLENGASEFIEHGKNGFVLRNWDDHEGLSGLFLKLKDRSVREKMGKSAHEALRCFTWDRTTEETLRVLEEAAIKKTFRLADRTIHSEQPHEKPGAPSGAVWRGRKRDR